MTLISMDAATAQRRAIKHGTITDVSFVTQCNVELLVKSFRAARRQLRPRSLVLFLRHQAALVFEAADRRLRRRRTVFAFEVDAATFFA